MESLVFGDSLKAVLDLVLGLTCANDATPPE